MRRLPLREPFHAVFNWWGSFGYYDDGTNAAVLRGFVEQVAPHGRVLIHQVNRERILRDFRHEHSVQYGDVTIETRNVWDPARERIEGRWVITRGRRRQRCRSSMRVYTRAQMTRLMESAGLEVGGVYGDVDGRAYDRGTRFMTMVGRKP
jgi:hypothetical protein